MISFLKKIFGRKVTPEENGGKSTESSTKNASMSLEEYSELWDAKRRKKHKLLALQLKDGFHFRPYGRDGFIYYVNQGKLCEIDWEMSGVCEYDILIHFEILSEWYLPTQIKLTSEEKTSIKRDLKIWLKKKGLKSDLE